MGFTSALYPREIIINDSTPLGVIVPDTHSTGLSLPPRRASMTGEEAYEGVAQPFPAELLIPRSEWQARIQELEATETGLDKLSIRASLPCHDQDGIPYCWIHGPTHCMEIIRVVQNEPVVLLSATSVGCKIKNFRKQGGWGKEGLQYISDNGVCTQSDWPENKLDRQYDKPAAWEEAKKYEAMEWWVLRDRNLDELVSCLLRRIPVAGGYNWWSHEISNVAPVWLDGTVAIRIRNSWGMGWGDNGFSILQGNKMLPDDAVAPRVAA